jgi:hypothetical protein
VLLPSDTHRKPIMSITADSICDLFTDSPSYSNYAMGWTIEKSVFDSKHGKEDLSLIHRVHIGPIQPLLLWVPMTFLQGVKQQGCEADHLSLFSAEFKNDIPPFPHTSSWGGA